MYAGNSALMASRSAWFKGGALPANCSAFSWLVTSRAPSQEVLKVEDLRGGTGSRHRGRSLGLGLHIGTEVDRHVELYIRAGEVEPHRPAERLQVGDRAPAALGHRLHAVGEGAALDHRLGKLRVLAAEPVQGLAHGALHGAGVPVVATGVPLGLQLALSLLVPFVHGLTFLP